MRTLECFGGPLDGAFAAMKPDQEHVFIKLDEQVHLYGVSERITESGPVEVLEYLSSLSIA
jgi:hypothetical protein